MTDATQLATIFHTGTILFETIKEHSYIIVIEFSVNARFHDKTVHILRSSEPEAEAEPPPMAARSVLDRLA